MPPDTVSGPDAGAFRSIALFGRSESRFFIVAIARELKRRYGSRIHLFCGAADKAAFYESNNQDGVFDAVIPNDVLMQSAAEPADESAEVAHAREWERRVGVTYNWMAVTNRHLGRGYSLGGFRHPRSSVSENASYAQLLHAYNRTMDFWRDQFTRMQVTLVINGGREACVMARSMGVPTRSMAGSRTRNLHNWAWNEFYENPQFTETYRAIAASGAPTVEAEMNAPYSAHLANRGRFIANMSAYRLGKRAALEIARYAWWRLRGYRKARSYFLRENLAYFWRIWREWRLLLSLAGTTLPDLKGKPFVYYPLHLEPETALQGLSPEYFYQLSLIAAVSRDLPAGVRLAVKEAYGAVGRRPRDFYRQIAEFKNVVWLHPLEPGLDCVRQSSAVITICGTSGLEGAVHGKPVIAFGKHNIYNHLPHVRVVTDEARLAEYLGWALDPSFDNAEARRQGKLFLSAIVANSFDMRDYDYAHPQKFDPQCVVDCCDALAHSVVQKSSAKHAA